MLGMNGELLTGLSGNLSGSGCFSVLILSWGWSGLLVYFSDGS
jgi:hypothetical protein